MCELPLFLLGNSELLVKSDNLATDADELAPALAPDIGILLFSGQACLVAALAFRSSSSLFSCC